MSDCIPVARDAARAAAARHPQLTLLVLFGSRARPDATAESDWDFGYLADGPIDALALRADLARALETDRIDLAPLDRASALLRFRAARDGVPLLEREANAFARFWLEAVRFWCDVEPLVRRGHEAILAGLDP